METMIKNIGKQIKNGMSFPLGLDENNNFVFLIKDKKENIDKFLGKIENIDSISKTVTFINNQNKNKTKVSITIIKMNTGNYYPLFIIEGIENMLTKYNQAKNILLVFFDGENIRKETAVISKQTKHTQPENTLSKENHLDIFNFIKEVRPFELEALVAQVQRKEIKPEIFYN